jgi:predicted O-methyltransferase YrrM
LFGKQEKPMNRIKKAILRRLRRLANYVCKKIVNVLIPEVSVHIQNTDKQYALKFERLYAKYLIIYLVARFYKPRNILELGSGMSTTIFLKALKNNGFGNLTSLDEHKEYADDVNKTSGHNVIFSPAVETEYEGITGTKYEQIPDSKYDLIFVDGPTTSNIDLDAFIYLDKHPGTKVLIDNRKKTSFALIEKYGGKFNRFFNIGYVNF